jgi:hypothetical protein
MKSAFVDVPPCRANCVLMRGRYAGIVAEAMKRMSTGNRDAGEPQAHRMRGASRERCASVHTDAVKA